MNTIEFKEFPKNRPVLVNVDHIVLLEDLGDRTRIALLGGIDIIVEESYTSLRERLIGVRETSTEVITGIIRRKQ